MSQAAFDTLSYFEKLIACGVPEPLAKVQTDALRAVSNIQETRSKNDSSVKDDIQNIQIELEKIRGEIKNTELRLQKEIEQVKYSMLKWQIGGWLGLAAIMAKGFGWLGF